MPVGFDLGTGNLVSARKDESGKTIMTAERNCFLKIGAEYADMLGSSDFKYIKDKENGEDCLLVCGNDALRLSNLLQTNNEFGERKSSLRRPMAKMVINSKTEKKSIQMLKHLSQSLIGPPEYDNEIAVISIPADPLSKEFDVVFHKNICSGFIKEMGYEVYCLNEATAVGFASNPKTVDENNEELNMTGVCISFGSGGSNAALLFKSVPTVAFSTPHAGDKIDQGVSSVTSLTVSEVTAEKEKFSKDGSFSLSAPDYSIDVIGALYVYYKNMIEHVVKTFKVEFEKQGVSFSAPIEVICSGGTSKPNGFPELVAQVIEEVSWPFEIKGVRRAKDPLSATAVGCLTAAISKEKKKSA